MQAHSELDRMKALLTMVTGFLVLYFIFQQVWLLYIAAAVGVLSLLIPAIGKVIVLAWFKLAMLLGWINSRILLGIVFYLFLFPIALIFKLTSNNPLQIKNKEQNSTDDLFRLYRELRHRTCH